MKLILSRRESVVLDDMALVDEFDMIMFHVRCKTGGGRGSVLRT